MTQSDFFDSDFDFYVGTMEDIERELADANLTDDDTPETEPEDEVGERRAYFLKRLYNLAPGFLDPGEVTPCTGAEDPDLWFSDMWLEQVQAAVRCELCPAREKCAAWAVETKQKHGIWGGLSCGSEPIWARKAA